jgi:hypothetical protein
MNVLSELLLIEPSKAYVLPDVRRPEPVIVPLPGLM